MPRDVVRIPRDARDTDRRTALDEILAKGRTKTRQERWVVLGGLLMQGKRNLSYEEIRELAGYHADKTAVPSGYHNARTSYLPEPDRKRRKSA